VTFDLAGYVLLIGLPAIAGPFECPHIGVFRVSQDVGIPVVGTNAKVHSINAAPLIVNGFDKKGRLGNPKFNRPLVQLVA